MEEKVPITIPSASTIANSRITAPPKRRSAISVKSVVTPVTTVRGSVSLIDRSRIWM